MTVKLDVHTTAPPTSPTAQALAKANETIDVTDTLNRRITLKKPRVLDQLRLVELLGESAQNDRYLVMVSPLLYVQAIDGEALLFSTKRELEAAYQQLGEEGLTAVIEGIKKHFGASNEEDARANVKK